MNPKLNKLITLLLLLGTFAFLMEAEERLTAMANKELSKWASLLPVEEEPQQVQSLNPYAQKVSLLRVLLPDSTKKVNSVNN
ncbi:MAG: hypothetical protein RLN88_02255 [Ekhidna sp.]|uniref:hypothetical protein n=1 Tax=Ekhidna sp. TaxID=2608089 RepID=UPI0032EAF0CA